MARHRNPRELQVLKGADKVNPGRYANEVPKSDLPLGDAPEGMSDAAADCWRELSACALPGVLTGADRQVLEIVSNLFAEYRSDPVAFAIGKYAHLIGGLGRLGMSPADRQKVGVEKPKAEKPKFKQVS